MAIGSAVVLSGEVPIEIRDFANVSRCQWPVTGGVPLARGELFDAKDAALFDDAGRPCALQREVLARWDDGSVKWLLLDFFADVEARQSRTYRLKYGKDAEKADVPEKTELNWRETDEGIFVDTGPLRAVISHRVFERLSVKRPDGSWIDLLSRPGEMWISLNGDRQGRYSASSDKEAEVAVEQSGPNRICVRVTGWHYTENGKRFGPYTIRVHAYAGKPYLRVFHTFTNSIFPEDGLITGIGIRVPLALSGAQGINYGGLRAKFEGSSPCSLAQTDWNTQEIVHDGHPVMAERPVEGFLGVDAKGITAACFVRDWAQLFPKKLEWNSDGFTVWLWPESNCPLDLRREEQKQSEEWLWFKKTFPKAYGEWIDPGTAKSAGISARRYSAALRTNDLALRAKATAFGLARTHEMLFAFLPDGAGDEKLRELSAAFAEPLLPFANPRYMDKTEVLGRFGWEDRESFPKVENYLRRKLDWIIRHQNEWARWWGIIDWGGLQSIYETLRDVHIPGQWLKFMGRHGWHNSEVDIPFQIMYCYLRTGDRRIWHFYESILRHQMDVDTIHLNLPEFEAPDHKWSEDEWTRGGMHRHSYNHYSGACNIGHTWNEGLVNYYFLTGDRRAYDVAIEVGEYSLGSPFGKVRSAFEKWSTHEKEAQRFDRSPANAYRNVLKCYEMTGDSRWLDEAMKWRKHFLDHSPGYLGTQPATFHVTTYLVHTLALDYCMFKDERVGEEIATVARWHCDFMKRGYDERGLHYPYLACGMAWWITRDDDLLRWPWHTYLSECQSNVDKAQGPGDFPQCHFYEFGQIPFFLRACAEAGYSESNPPPAPVGQTKPPDTAPARSVEERE